MSRSYISMRKLNKHRSYILASVYVSSNYRKFLYMIKINIKILVSYFDCFLFTFLYFLI